MSNTKAGTHVPRSERGAAVQGMWADLALHTLGWKAFQDLCAHVLEEVLKRPVEIFREAQDGGQDAVFLLKPTTCEVGVATVQCKFSHKSDSRLHFADVSGEIESIRTLVSQKQVTMYVIMTNMSVDAPVAAKLRKQVQALGVPKAHVFGKHFLTRVIRSSARLRALVPRVYGLGDLSIILDERSARQTEALLGHLLPLLKVYVPTAPHVEAVKKLSKHGIVLLLGAPATGKSTIAAILATVACENRLQCIRADGPEDLIANWNPDEKNSFFWIDDAFGPNQVREDFVDRWISIIPKVLAAIARGSQFVLTSRLHIWNAAEPKLGTRNIPALRERHAIVNVGVLAPDERRQILYNHIKGGKQPLFWKAAIKPHLEALASHEGLLPEIARRLADPAYTKQISPTLHELRRFVEHPKAYLVQTIKEMSKEHRAALTLIFLHNGLMPVGARSSLMQELVIRHFAVDPEHLDHALSQLKGSFVVQRVENGELVWSFAHPTITDAISAILGEAEGLTELYLRGTKPDVVLKEAVCIGARQIPDAIIIPESLNELLADVLVKTPNARDDNYSLFTFLEGRASESLFRKVIERQPSMLERSIYWYSECAYNPKINVLARAHSYRLLPDDLRAEVAQTLTSAILSLDTSFIDDDDLLALVPPTELLATMAKLRKVLLDKVEEAADSVLGDIDFNKEPDEHFYELQSQVDQLKDLLLGGEADQSLSESIDEIISGATEQVEERKRDKIDEDRAERRNWEGYVPSPPRASASTSPAVTHKRIRSVFSDVDD